MPSLLLDHNARQQIRQVLQDSSHGDVYALIPLPDGNILLMLAHAGNVAFCLIDEQGDDLFDPHLMQDVGALVLADLQRNRERLASNEKGRPSDGLFKCYYLCHHSYRVCSNHVYARQDDIPPQHGMPPNSSHALDKRSIMNAPKFLLVCCAVLMAGCATTAKYEAKLASWVGSPEGDLILSWGPPQQVYETDGGVKYLTYSSSRQVYIPGTAPTYTTNYNPYTNSATTTSLGGTPAQSFNMGCQTTFQVSNGTISSWSWKGNDCTSQ
ncbi:hypothetical protein M5G20_05490 [Pseudomonas sp. TNT2022 ID1044]|uniref:hypothetical protein n=1 Tax=Pseudomonas sp. TNT2022 ID1044 TaxID=2942636 RepID=UPI00235E4060|nr:hypothetical protein [Pseudomonas sp. TNT2022 ID1044]MDD0995319.1 hypothetical protein [Pseudomonas sp. TNT2022 ID1044]